MKKYKRILSLAVIAALTFALFGAANAEAATRSINVAIAAEPSSFDTGPALGDSLMYIIGLVEEGLTRYGDNQQLVDGLAESYEHNDDYTQWTFHLRESGWSNGDPVQADDWVYGISRILDGTTDVSYPDFVYEIKNARAVFAGEVPASELGVTALDEKTVVFDLEYPVTYFPKLITHCMHFGVNRAFVDSVGMEVYGTEAEYTAYNGPYYIASWDHDDKFLLKKNEYYWNKDALQIDEVNVFIVPNEATQVNMFINGELDIVDFSAARLDVIRGAGFEEKVYNNGRTAYLQYNLANEFLSNKSIRQAISSAINREPLVVGVVKNGSSVADGLIPIGLSGDNERTFREIVGSNNPYPYDSAKAKELLAQGLEELGVTADQITLRILATNTDEFSSVTGALQQLLQEELG
ncbi:MAG: peptide ABC transporter substrate-binding protein, partial [Clostridia bacterium]|nr:peptide ABC transporter substrate-binding protein [Clostridia bacterium]